jgi:hypothetical protein
VEEASRAYRRAQLGGVLAFDREMFVNLYRNAVGLAQNVSVPLSVSYSQMVDAILDGQQSERLVATTVPPVNPQRPTPLPTLR